MKTHSFDSFEEAGLSQSPDFGVTTESATLAHPFAIVLVAVLSSFAVGSIPVIYAFTQAHSQNQTAASTPVIRGEMF